VDKSTFGLAFQRRNAKRTLRVAQRVEARAGDVAADFDPAGVHDVADAVDRHGRLGDVGGQDDLSVFGAH
jgi:hypothetical protein